MHYRFIAIAIALFFPFVAHCQGVPEPEWTAQERQFVGDMRALYQKQGVPFSSMQEESAVKQLRDQQRTTRRGIPQSEWTPKEAEVIAQYRAMYQKQGIAFSEEQSAMAVQSMRDQMAKITGGLAALQAGGSVGRVSPSQFPSQNLNNGTAAIAPQAYGANRITEEQIAAQISQTPAGAKGFKVKESLDGFSVDGQPFIDAEGSITMYGYDVVTGDITYAVDSPSGTVIKYTRAKSQAPAITIANATKTDNGWSVQTVTGQRLSGLNMTMMPKGFLAGRPGAAITYSPGEGVKSIGVPDSYSLAHFQRGNIGQTRYVLVEKAGPAKGDSLGQIFSSVKAIGAITGLSKKEDYALFNVDTGKIIPLNVDSNGKEVTVLSDCYQRKKNSFIRDCYTSQSFTSLYEATGQRNGRHYFWRIQWFNTTIGPIAVSLESGSSDIYVTNLATGERVVAFNRSLGINEMTATQSGDGTIQIEAMLGLSRERIEDAASLLKGTPQS